MAFDPWVIDDRVLNESPYGEEPASPIALGGVGSGNFGHEGRPGEVGGSTGDGSGATAIPAGKKGECFRNAGRFLREHEQEGFKLIHGKVTNALGKTFDHAWAENEADVADATTGVRMDKERWYKAVQAKPETEYTAEEMAINALRTGHWGPWTTAETTPRRRRDLGGGELE